MYFDFYPFCLLVSEIIFSFINDVNDCIAFLSISTQVRNNIDKLGYSNILLTRMIVENIIEKRKYENESSVSLLKKILKDQKIFYEMVTKLFPSKESSLEKSYENKNIESLSKTPKVDSKLLKLFRKDNHVMMDVIVEKYKNINKRLWIINWSFVLMNSAIEKDNLNIFKKVFISVYDILRMPSFYENEDIKLINYLDKKKNFFMNTACKNGSMKIIKYLYEEQSIVDMKNVNLANDKNSCLYIAIKKKYLHVVKYFLDKSIVISKDVQKAIVNIAIHDWNLKSNILVDIFSVEWCKIVIDIIDKPHFSSSSSGNFKFTKWFHSYENTKKLFIKNLIKGYDIFRFLKNAIKYFESESVKYILEKHPECFEKMKKKNICEFIKNNIFFFKKNIDILNMISKIIVRYKKYDCVDLINIFCRFIDNKITSKLDIFLNEDFLKYVTDNFTCDEFLEKIELGKISEDKRNNDTLIKNYNLIIHVLNNNYCDVANNISLKMKDWGSFENYYLMLKIIAEKIEDNDLFINEKSIIFKHCFDNIEENSKIIFLDYLIRRKMNKCLSFFVVENKFTNNNNITSVDKLKDFVISKIQTKNYFGYLSFAEIIFFKDYAKLQLLLKQKDPSEENNFPIRLACRIGATEIVKLLLSDKRVDSKTHNNYCMKIAQQNNFQEIITLLKKKIILFIFLTE